MLNATISVIIRYHDSRRIFEIERALMSIMMQTYPNVEVIVTTQRFDGCGLKKINDVIANLRRIDNTFLVRVVNFPHSSPIDARSALLNLGLRNASGRYIAFLDYDDTMHTSAYEKLIQVIDTNGSAAAFGGVVIKCVSLERDYCVLRARRPTYMQPLGLADLFYDNHCPIHSFVLDRTKIDADLLNFDNSVQRAEDWQFLLKICANHATDFSLKTTVIGDYFFKDDGSNTSVTTDGLQQHAIHPWLHAAKEIDVIRRKTYLSKEVQRNLDLKSYRPTLSIQQYLEMRDKDGRPQNFVSHLLAPTA